MFIYPKLYDVIVVGGGHAGVEASLAAARMGCTTLLITSNLDTIAQMSCNPAIGGIGKGQLVREVDALGGEMGLNTDHTGIQFRMLNTKNGPSVWAPRAQCDKKAYQFRMKFVLESQHNLDLKQGLAEEIIAEQNQFLSIRTHTGATYRSRALVVTTGTFLQGLIHIGKTKIGSGRASEPPSNSLSSSLKRLGLEMGRLKTGTPPRICRRSINFSSVTPQHGDMKPSFF